MGHRVYGSSLVWRGDILPGQRASARAISCPDRPITIILPTVQPASAHRSACPSVPGPQLHRRSRSGHGGRMGSDLPGETHRALQLGRLFRSVRQPADHAAPRHREFEADGGRTFATGERAQRGLLAACWRADAGLDQRLRREKSRPGIAQMHESTMERQRQQANLWVPQTLLLEAEIFGEVKQYQRAYALLDEAQALIEPSRSAALRGGTASRPRRGDNRRGRATAPAGSRQHRARDRSCARQNARVLELRATVVKARLLAIAASRRSAGTLEPVYHSFSEGFDTVDLVETRASAERVWRERCVRRVVRCPMV